MKQLLSTFLLFSIVCASFHLQAQTEFDPLDFQHKLSDEFIERLNFPHHISINPYTGEVTNQKIKKNGQIYLVDSLHRLSWDDFNSSWEIVQKTNAIAYDSLGNLLVSHAFNPDANGNLFNEVRVFNHYDNNDNLIKTLQFRWDGVAFDTSQIWTYAYNSDNYLTYEDLLSFDASTNTWKKLSKAEFTYDNQNKMLTSKYYSADDNNNWYLYTEVNYHYNTNDLLERKMGNYYWDLMTSSWNTIARDSTLYDTNNNPILYKRDEWNGSIWIPTSKSNLTYDANQNNIGIVSETWSTASNSWENYARITQVFDNNNIPIERLDENWNSSNNSWENFLKSIRTYNGVFTEIKHDIWVNGAWEGFRKYTYNYSPIHQKILENRNYYFETASNSYIGTSGHNWYYSLHTVSNTETTINQPNIKVFPNPATTYISFDFPNDITDNQVSVFDATGKMIEQTQLYLDKTLNVEHLPNGLYFIMVQTNNQNYSFKIIKQ